MKAKIFEKNWFRLICLLLYFFSVILIIVASKYNWATEYKALVVLLFIAQSITYLIYPILKKEKVSALEIVLAFFGAVCLIFGVVVIISFQEENLKNVLIPVIASVIGGLFALYGIGLTIKFNRLSKKEDDIKKAMPNVFCVSAERWKSLGTKRTEKSDVELSEALTDLKITAKGNNLLGFKPILLANSDFSMCTLKGIRINRTYFIVFCFDYALLKGCYNSYVIKDKFEMNESLRSIELIFGDMLDNNYAARVSYQLEKKEKTNETKINITSIVKYSKVRASKFNHFEDENYEC